MPAPLFDFLHFDRTLRSHLRGKHFAYSITSPIDIVEIEELRRREKVHLDAVRSAAADVFVLGLGEPEEPFLSKVGGRPYWPADLPWPTFPTRTASGELIEVPYDFFAQLYFGDSRDIVGETPGDVLLLFGEQLPGRSGWNRNRLANFCDSNLHFAWQNVGNFALTPRAGSVLPCIGFRHRTIDYYRPRYSEPEFYERENPCYVFGGLKVGGLPVTTLHSDLRFLGSIGGVDLVPDRPFPWVNRQQPLTQAEIDALPCLGNQNGETLSIFLDDRGAIRVAFDFIG